MDKKELLGKIRDREQKMLTQAKDEILGGGDFLPVNRLAELFSIRIETLTPALIEWEGDNRIFSIEHEGCYLFPRYAFSTRSGLTPHPALKEVLSILSPTKSSWLVAFWFSSSNGMLGGKRPRDLISSDAVRVILAAQSEVDGVLHG
ncbi:hypothetical protein [Pseudomonas sp. GW101-3H06]|uniref:hypothetical protein n=1 Tax=Pseudomonas sp. GW101-3H06 TaxID=2751347 RepID=UPI001A911D19|nr:hypothetical protein [Pseudomonas sp. GW101-3H06]